MDWLTDWLMLSCQLEAYKHMTKCAVHVCLVGTQQCLLSVSLSQCFSHACQWLVQDSNNDQHFMLCIDWCQGYNSSWCSDEPISSESTGFNQYIIDPCGESLFFRAPGQQSWSWRVFSVSLKDDWVGKCLLEVILSLTWMCVVDLAADHMSSSTPAHVQHNSFCVCCSDADTSTRK